MNKQTFYDCVNGVVIRNLGLADPTNVFIDVHVDDCKFHKIFNTGI
jgi:hypothetical protein